MAEKPVIVPVNLEVTDVDLAEVDMEKVVVEETVKKGSYDGDIVNPQSGDEYVEAEEASPEADRYTSSVKGTGIQPKTSCTTTILWELT